MNLNNIIKLSRILSKLESMLTDRGELVSDEPLAVGVKVYDAEGEPAEDGLYISETQTITVVGGVVTEITDIEKPKTEEEQAEESTTETAEPDEKDTKITELEEKISELEAKIAELESKLSKKEEELKNANEKLSAPIKEQKKEVKAPIFKSYLK